VGSLSRRAGGQAFFFSGICTTAPSRLSRPERLGGRQAQALAQARVDLVAGVDVLLEELARVLAALAMRSPSKENQAPDFSTILCSTASRAGRLPC